MQIEKHEMVEFAELVATAVVGALKEASPRVSNRPTQTAFQKTETLLANYMELQKIIKEKRLEIEELRAYGVPQQCGSVGERVQNGALPKGIVLPEESVEAAVRTVEYSIREAVQALANVDRCMAALKNDPYYRLLEMLYFEGRTQEDIAYEFKCTQQNVSLHKNRLIKELAMRMFPSDVVREMLE